MPKCPSQVNVVQQILPTINSSNYCSGANLSCDAFGNIVRINFVKYPLRKTIPKNIWILSELETLVISSSSLRGEIPNSIGGLKQLTVLNLYDNALNGNIPDSVCNLKRLKSFTLKYNRLSGNFPPCIGNMTTLVNLVMSYNNLSGLLPSMFYLSNLKLISFYSNFLSGPLPDLPLQTTQFHFSFNNFSGSIPENYKNLIQLQEFWVDSNNLSGAFSDDLFDKMKMIKEILVGGNNFVGSIPSSICSNSLNYTNFSSNLFTGKIPSCLSKLPTLTSVSFDSNRLSGPIPIFSNNTICNASKNLDLCVFPGNSPTCGVAELCLTDCALMNAWTSVIKASNCCKQKYVRCKNGEITKLYLSSLGLNGTIPDLTSLKSLKHLDLSRNRLTGIVPSQLGKLTKLVYLFVLPF